jgi:DNA mismatch repair protein MutS
MEELYPRVKNFNVSVKESSNKVIFLRKLMRGGSEHSFGIHVARMAGMPRSIVDRSEVVLKQLERNHANGSAAEAVQQMSDTMASGNTQLSFFQLDDPVLMQIRDELLQVDINNLTPMEALNKLDTLKRIVTGK